MRSSKDLSVFDFNVDDAQEAAGKLTKFQFLQAFTSNMATKQVEVINLSHIDSHEVESPQRFFSPGRNVASIDEKSKFDEVSTFSAGCHDHGRTCKSDFSCGAVVQEEAIVLETPGILVASVWNDGESGLQSSETDDNVMTDDEGNWTTSEASPDCGDLSEDEGQPEYRDLVQCSSPREEMDDGENAVILRPDYVIHGKTLFVESQLTFFPACIKLECFDASRTDESITLECDISDIIRIGCQWSGSVEALLIKFCIRTKIGHDAETFLASVADLHWLDKEQKIKSLSETYTDIWDTLPDNDHVLEDDVFRTNTSFSKRYFTKIMEPFEDVIYPKGDPDAVSLGRRDVELLEPDTFINDTIIDFYIKYLQKQIQPNEKSRFHFFNSFFFRKLADLDKDPSSISEGRAAFRRVHKWTRKLNIFEKDYIFIPVNFNLHWSLLVICHSGEIATFREDDIKESSKVPCVLHMDSIKGSHSGLKNLIQSYLLEEWKGRHPEMSEEVSSKFSNLRFVSLELPQQENSSDCGLFLLHYVELFLEEAPVHFNPSKITKLSNFLSADWFPPAEASFKRFHIRGLIYGLLRNSSQNIASTCSNGDFPCTRDDIDQAMEFFSVQDTPLKSPNGSAAPLQLELEDNIPVQQDACLKVHSSECSIEEQEDTKAETTELLIREIAVGDGCPSRDGSSTPKICSTSTSPKDSCPCERTSTFEQEKDEPTGTLPTTSIGSPGFSNNDDGLLLQASIDSCGFVPDTPTINDNLKLEDCVQNLQETDTSKLEMEKHENPQESSDTHTTDALTSCSEHCREADPNDGDCRNGEDSIAENVDVKGCEPINHPDNRDMNFIDSESTEKLDHLGSGNAAIDSVISLDSDDPPVKRNKISGSEQQVSKRRKTVHPDMVRRVTRRSKRGSSS
ncbi:putative ubiquitin-like-specific protease 2B [Apostasia shenzhenica]|uniref:Putative ubiquitin-like-specific protease 2B n=1 Tax=Apostasia shenzhenica TaxID=1088818 RepID=A0A2I0AZS8_9ASPA|nr:putative ubiquitin-like-specific protease 2B [Apostasia shenzhenica]